MRLYADDIMFFISNTTSVLQAQLCSEGFSFLRMSEQQIKEKKHDVKTCFEIEYLEQADHPHVTLEICNMN